MNFVASGYGLANVCEAIGYKFKHHDALEDAKAAGNILLAAMAKTGLDLNGWLARVRQPIDPTLEQRVVREGNPDGALYGEVRRRPVLLSNSVERWLMNIAM